MFAHAFDTVDGGQTLAVCDFNHDGLADVVIGHGEGATLYLQADPDAR